MRTYLAERAKVNPAREFFLLWFSARTCQERSPSVLLTTCVATRRHRQHDAADDDQHDDRGHKEALRFSLAGVQLKFSAVSEASGGLTIPTKGVGGSWIAKLPSREFEGVAENEFSMMTLARYIGMNVPTIRLIDPTSIKNLPEGLGTLKGQALAIERFDRLEGGQAVHIEDFAQVYGVYPEDKYKRAKLSQLSASYWC